MAVSGLKALNVDHIITDPVEKANILNKHFEYVFTVEDRETIPNKGISLFPSLPDFEITTQGVYTVQLIFNFTHARVRLWNY